MEIEEIKREMQTSQRSQPAEREEETQWPQQEKKRKLKNTRSDYQSMRKNWKHVLSGDTNNNRQQAKTTETSKYV